MRLFMLLIALCSMSSVQAQNEPITPHNVDQVVELQRIGNGYSPTVRISPNEQTIAVTSSIGVWLYDANDLTLEPRFFPFVRGYGNVNYSTDSSRLVATLSDSSLRVWDVETGTVQLDLFDHRDNLYQAKFSPDGRYIVSTGVDNARIWDAQTGEMLHFLEMGSAQPINFSPDGQQVVIGGGDGSARVWDIVTGELLLSLIGHERWVNVAIYSPDGKTILTASRDGDVRLWDAETGLLQYTLIGNIAIANAFYNANGDKIISVAGDKVWVWDVKTALPIFILGSHLDNVRSGILNYDETELLTTDSDNSIYRWNMQTGELIEAYEAEISRHVIADSKDFEIGQIYTVTDDTITIMNIETNQTVSFPNTYHPVANRMIYNPEKDWMLTLGRFDPDVYLWDAKTWEVIDIFSAENHLARAFFLPDNQRLIIGAQGGRFTVWDIKTHEEILTSEKSYATLHIEISADGQHLFSNDPYSENFVWNIETGEELRNIEQFLQAELENQPTTQPAQIDGLIIETNYTWYYSHGVVELWDAQTGELLNILEGHTEGPLIVILSDDKTRLFTTSNDGTIRIWGIP